MPKSLDANGSLAHPCALTPTLPPRGGDPVYRQIFDREFRRFFRRVNVSLYGVVHCRDAAVRPGGAVAEACELSARISS
jgi:hypothetical protein